MRAEGLKCQRMWKQIYPATLIRFCMGDASINRSIVPNTLTGSSWGSREMRPAPRGQFLNIDLRVLLRSFASTLRNFCTCEWNLRRVQCLCRFRPTSTGKTTLRKPIFLTSVVLETDPRLQNFHSLECMDSQEHTCILPDFDHPWSLKNKHFWKYWFGPTVKERLLCFFFWGGETGWQAQVDDKDNADKNDKNSSPLQQRAARIILSLGCLSLYQWKGHKGQISLDFTNGQSSEERNWWMMWSRPFMCIIEPSYLYKLSQKFDEFGSGSGTSTHLYLGFIPGLMGNFSVLLHLSWVNRCSGFTWECMGLNLLCVCKLMFSRAGNWTYFAAL